MKTLQRASLWSLIVVMSMVGISRIEAFLDGKDPVLSVLITVGTVFVVVVTFELLFPRNNNAK